MFKPRDRRLRWALRFVALAAVGMIGVLASYATAGAASGPTGDSTTTAAMSCTREHPCANPACAQAGHGPLDCYTPTTTATTTDDDDRVVHP